MAQYVTENRENDGSMSSFYSFPEIHDIIASKIGYKFWVMITKHTVTAPTMISAGHTKLI